MKKMNKYVLLIFGVFLFTSCELDDNVDPNNPGTEQITARQRLTAAQTSPYSVQAEQMNELGNVWMNSWAGNIYYFGNPAVDETQLILGTNFYSSIWNSMYLSVGKLQAIIDSPAASELPYHTAIAKILKSYYMQYLVDLYGDLPYEEAFEEGENVAPAYTNDEEVYAALVDELIEANDLISNSTPSEANKVFSTEDVMFGGNMEQWERFANTVLLKYAVRLSKTSNSKGVEVRNKILPYLSGKEFIIDDVKIQPGYNASSSESQNPLYRGFGLRTYTGSVNTYGWRLYRASSHMVETLKGSTGTIAEGIYDDRISTIFGTPFRGGDYRGLIQGAPKEDLSLNDLNFSGFGGFFEENASVGSTVDGVVMMLAEAELLQAEASEVFPTYFGNGEMHFNNAVQASFDFAGLGDSAADYLSAINDKDGVGWVGSADKIAAIQYQRWIALTNFNAMETFINYKRTGYPETPLALTATKPNKPYRLMYPSTEYTSNSSNVPNVSADQCFSINEFTPFWYN
ncbi:MAG: SusD/RagB family nutrient-binding outer membrane lipoprotein [Weeksellaceae bacterium]